MNVKVNEIQQTRVNDGSSHDSLNVPSSECQSDGNSHTVTIETNFQQGDLETKVDGTKGDVTDTETAGLWFACESAF